MSPPARKKRAADQQKIQEKNETKKRVAMETEKINTTRWRPYRCEYTESLQNSEVIRSRARIVLRWGTAREVLRVLPALLFFRPKKPGTKNGTKKHVTAGTKKMWNR